MPTKILTFEANLRPETDGIWRDFPTLVVIPGNPGEIQYYEEFMRLLYDHFEEQVTICGVSHAGHHKLLPGMQFPPLQENANLYDLQAQILHKIEFLRRFVGVDREVILVGHSIGAYIAMQVMKREPRLKCEKAILLFPVFERMIHTEHAQAVVKSFHRWQTPIMLLVNLISFTPHSIKRWICSLLHGQPHLGEATASYLSKHALQSSWFMAKDEFDKVDKRDDSFIKRSWRLLSFYYGARDHWCPLEYFEEMKKDHPQCDLTLCDRDIEHAFVLNVESTKYMASFTADRCKGVL